MEILFYKWYGIDWNMVLYLFYWLCMFGLRGGGGGGGFGFFFWKIIEI